MPHEPCAIVGIGQTHHKSRRWDVSLGGLVREAAVRALEDAHLDWPDIDAVVLGKAPDLFEGVMKPELYLTDALGAHGKPMFRVHTAGSVGGTTGIVASHLVESQRHTRVLAVAYQNQLTNARIHVYLATSIDNGVTWSYTHSRLDTGIGSAILPAITATTVGVEPGAVIGWTDFRAGTGVNGDIFTVVSH